MHVMYVSNGYQAAKRGSLQRAFARVPYPPCILILKLGLLQEEGASENLQLRILAKRVSSLYPSCYSSALAYAPALAKGDKSSAVGPFRQSSDQQVGILVPSRPCTPPSRHKPRASAPMCPQHPRARRNIEVLVRPAMASSARPCISHIMYNTPNHGRSRSLVLPLVHVG